MRPELEAPEEELESELEAVESELEESELEAVESELEAVESELESLAELLSSCAAAAAVAHPLLAVRVIAHLSVALPSVVPYVLVMWVHTFATFMPLSFASFVAASTVSAFVQYAFAVVAAASSPQAASRAWAEQ